MKHRHLICGGLALLIFSLLGAGGGNHALAGADSKFAPVPAQSVKGEVVMLGGEVCVVRDEAGKSVLFKIDKGTKIEGAVKEGKKVEVSASADGQAIAIKEIS